MSIFARWTAPAAASLGLMACVILAFAMPSASLAAPGDSDAHGSGADDKQQADPSADTKRTIQQWTEKGMSPNPIAMSFDPQGNLYVVQVGRAGQAVLDQRWPALRNNDGVINDLQKTSVADRAKEIEALIANGTLTREHFTDPSDQVSIIRDTNGDGVADAARVFAGGFNDELDGIAAGVLWHDGKVYLTNIPNVWLLQDLDGDGDADKETPGERVSLSYGYGVRWTFYGHDLHGLTLGPDGRIYFSIGDRGFNVTTKEGKHLFGPDRGAVFRMWPDGSGLELFHQGLRNPQELAFDAYGNLFTGDNNSDRIDQARFAHLVEGGDSGWRQDVQSLDSRGPWNREKMWEPRIGKDDLSQPAWIIPPLANIGRGPAGLAHYPGTGDSFPNNGSFLLCDFPGKVINVQTKPEGAGFAVDSHETFLDGNDVTDVIWGYDGRLYLSEWGGGWSSNPNGYIFTMTNDAVHNDPQKQAAIQEVEELFKQGFEQMAVDRLITFLGHQDQRVRLAAQYALAKQDGVARALGELARSASANQLARIHAIWTLSMLAREQAEVAELIVPVLDAADPQVRTQGVKMLADLRYQATDRYIAMLRDDHSQARYYAALALGKTAAAEAVEPLFSFLETNDNQDPILRHGGAYALSLIAAEESMQAARLIEAAAERSAAVRLGVVLALRQLDSPQLAEYLGDPDVLVAAEAVRAIYDKRVMEAFATHAAALDSELPAAMRIEPVLRRLIETNVRLGTAASASRLAAFAADPGMPDAFRRLAIDELVTWGNERNREGVWGKWWPRETQPAEQGIAALASTIDQIIASSTGQLQNRAREVYVQYVIGNDSAALEGLALNPQEPLQVRIAALKRLIEADPAAATRVSKAIAQGKDEAATMKISARAVLAQIDLEAAIASYLNALNAGTLAEQQDAVKSLAGIDAEGARLALAEMGDDLVQRKIKPELRLDLFNALNSLDDQNLKKYAQQYDAQNRTGDQAWIRDAVLFGGDVDRGRDVFYNNDASQCQRCHTVEKGAADTVGPNLWNIGADYDVDYLYRSLADPNADIAKGFASSTLTFADGKTLSGRVIEQSDQQVVLVDAQGNEHTHKPEQIIEITSSSQSQMPPMGSSLTQDQTRDLLAYLVSLNDPEAEKSTWSIVNPVVIDHRYVLPIFMLSVCVALGLLLLATLLLGGKRA